DELDDLVRPLPARRLHLDLVADALLEQGAADRRRERYLPLRDVDLFGGHDLVEARAPGVPLLDRAPRSVGHHAVRYRGELADGLLELRPVHLRGYVGLEHRSLRPVLLDQVPASGLRCELLGLLPLADLAADELDDLVLAESGAALLDLHILDRGE